MSNERNILNTKQILKESKSLSPLVTNEKGALNLFKQQHSSESPGLRKMLPSSGGKLCHIIGASKNITANADANININELLAN